MRKTKRNLILFIGLFFLDRLSKIAVLRAGFASINQNIFFGLWKFSDFWVLPVTAVFLLSVLFFFKMNNKGWLFVITGGFANLVDRLIFGGVVDFIDLKIIPVFNFGDIFICLGIGLLLIDFVKAGKLE